ncbi:hypothetical protein BGZ76_001456 [Entomortierella beljakovae]|nr:hypothetical protein BGZ76_001456 [Entomortierella beljakovae]
MIRKASYKVVVVIRTSSEQPQLPSETISSQAQAQAHEQWQSTRSSTNTTHQVPIHLIKRQRAVLIKDIERIAPNLQEIVTDDGTLVFNHTSQLEQTLDAVNSNPGSNDVPLSIQAATTSTYLPTNSEIASSGNSSNGNINNSQNKLGHIPILEGMEDSIWYIIVRPAGLHIEPTSECGLSEPKTAQKEQDDGQNQPEKELATVKGGLELCENFIDLQAHSSPNLSIQSESANKSRPYINVMKTNFSTQQTHEQQEQYDESEIMTETNETQQILTPFTSVSTATVTGPITNTTSAAPTTEIISDPASSTVAISVGSVTSIVESGHTSVQQPQPMASSCTNECQQNTALLHTQIVELAKSVLHVIDSGDNTINDIEHLRSKAVSVLNNYSSAENVTNSNNFGLIASETTSTTTPFSSLNRIQHVEEQRLDSGCGCRQEEQLTSDNSMRFENRNDNRDPMLQDSVSHFSGYRMNFLSTSLTNVVIEESKKSDLASPPSTTTSSKAHSKSISLAKSRNSFMAIFGKGNNPSSPNSENPGGVSIAEALGVDLSKKKLEKKSRRNKRNEPQSTTEPQAATANSSRRNSWFKTASAVSTNRKRVDSLDNNRNQEPSSTNLPLSGSESSSSSTSSTSRGFFSATSSLTTSPNLTPDRSNKKNSSTRRFSMPFSFQVRSSASSLQPPSVVRRQAPMSLPIIPPPRVSSIGVSPRFPRDDMNTREYIPTHRVQEPVYSLPRQRTVPFTAQIYVPGQLTQTGTGSYFDSVSDDDSDSDDALERHRSVAPQLANRPTNISQHSYVVYGSQHQVLRTQETLQCQVYDRDLESNDDSDNDDTDSRYSEGHYEALQTTQHTDFGQTWSNSQSPTSHSPQIHFDPQTLEGYDHQNDDSPPPSYHSLIRNNNATIATGQNNQYYHQSIAGANGVYSLSVLQTLLNLLHEFEINILEHFKTPAFQSSTNSDATASSQRCSWRRRNPETVASFSYVLIELEQVGIMPSAMHEAWRNLVSTSSPTFTGVSVPSGSSRLSIASMVSSPPLRPTITNSSTNVISTEVTEQDWLTMAGNATTESHLARVMLVLEQNCIHGMDSLRWHGHHIDNPMENTSTRSRWITQVVNIANSFTA